MAPKRYRLRRRITLLVLFGGLIALGMVIRDKFHQIEEIRIKKITIVGTHFCPEIAVKTSVKKYYDQNLFWIWAIPSYKNKLLKQFPQAQKIIFHFKYPSQLVIQFFEKAPFVILQGKAETALLSNDGTWLQKIPQIPTNNKLLVVQGVSPKWAFPKANPIVMAKLLLIQSKLKPIHLESCTVLFRALSLSSSANGDDIVLLKDTHTAIKMGSLESFQEKLAAVDTFLNRKSGTYISRNATVIDVRVPHKVFAYYGQ